MYNDPLGNRPLPPERGLVTNVNPLSEHGVGYTYDPGKFDANFLLELGQSGNPDVLEAYAKKYGETYTFNPLGGAEVYRETDPSNSNRVNAYYEGAWNKSANANQGGDPHINWGLSTDPNPFNLKKIGNGYTTQVMYQETWFYVKLGSGWNRTRIEMNININVNIKGRLTPDGEIQKFNKPLAQIALAAAFDNARKLTYDEWQRGRVFESDLMETFLENLNMSLEKPFLAPAYAAPVKPGGWKGVPMSNIRFNGLFIFY